MALIEATPSAVAPTQGFRTAVSHSHDPRLAAEQLYDRLYHPQLGFVLFFVSAEFELTPLGEALNEVFAEVPLAGCTTAGEITPEGYERGCIVAIGFDHGHFGVAATLLEDIDSVSLMDAQQRVDTLLGYTREHFSGGVGNTFALTLLDGLSSSEEQVLITLDAALGGIPSFGGSAGDDNRLTHTHVFAGGRFHNNAAAVILFTTAYPFEVFSTHHLHQCGEKLVVTAADPGRRRVLELNAMPAVEEYARLVGVAVAELDEVVFARHPLAVRLGESWYIRSIQRVNPDGSLSFYCAVENGIVLTAMQASPILSALDTTLAELSQRLGPMQLIIGCDCFLRRLELESLGLLDEGSRRLAAAGVVGFNTYGEQHHGMHINQTFTGVAIGTAR